MPRLIPVFFKNQPQYSKLYPAENPAVVFTSLVKAFGTGLTFLQGYRYLSLIDIIITLSGRLSSQPKGYSFP
jgi:hypothetical protein